jgi:MFS transporter, ACS family, hexuronate transporter
VTAPGSAASLNTQPAPAGRWRWLICALLFSAVVLSYIDRQVLSVLKPTLAARYGWSESGYGDVVFWFQAAYGIGYIAFGRLVDRFGARLGYTVAVALWTLGHLAHVFVTSTRGMALVRIPLAVGESGTFPSALAATSEWFPARERAFAIGLFNAGANVGAILTPLLVPAVTLAWGWRAAFIGTGMLTILWLIAWLALYRRPREQPRLSAAELRFIEQDPRPPRQPVTWSQVLAARQAWAYVLGRFLIDPVWWTFLFWLPDFLSKRFGVDLRGFGPPLVVIYVAADLGSISGGWSSSRLLARGVSLNAARKLTMLGCALVVIPVAFAADVDSLWFAVALIALASAGHQGFSANLYALPADLFPPWAAGTVVGLGGGSGAAGGMLMAKYAGWVLQTLGGYRAIFLVASGAYLIALLVVHALTPRYHATALGRNA